MTKHYMVGTVDDKPLLMVSVNGADYFVDEEAGTVYADKPGLPTITNEEEAATVLQAAKE